MNKTLWTLTSIFILTRTCLGQYSQEFHKIIEYKTCKILIDTVDRNWVFNKKENYYESNFTPTDTESKEIILPCITGAKKDDIKLLLGNPSVQLDNLWKYYTSPINRNGFAETYLTIEFEYSRVKKIIETNCKETLEFIRKNWKHKKLQDYYNTSFTPDRQGTKKIEMPCINKLDRHIFQNVFGDPHLAFKLKTMTPMQKVEWDDKGREIEPKPIDNQIIIYRYYTSSRNTKKKFETNIMEVTFYPANKNRQAVNRIETKNCENIINTLKSRLNFNDSLDHYQYKKTREYDFLQDVKLYSTCLYGMDTSKVTEIFGRPSVIKNKTEWEYYTSDYHYQDRYMGNGMTLHFYDNGNLSNIVFIWAIPIISPSH